MKVITSVKHRIVGLKNWFMKASWKKKILVVVVVGVLVFILTSPLRPKPSTFTTEPVTRTTISDLVSESGNVEGTSQFQVVSPSTGYLVNLYVKNGDTVKAGQQLFEVKSAATADEKASAYASYMQAKSALDAANATAFNLRSTMYTNWKKFTDLATNDTYENGDNTPKQTEREAAEFQVAQDNWLGAEAAYKNQQTVIAANQAAFNSASLTYQSTQDRVVTAPIGGTVANLAALQGDKVTANSSLAVGTTVMYIGDFSKKVVKIGLNEVDINKISEGQSANLTFDAMRDASYSGQVKMIDTVGTNTAGVITYDAYVTINNADDKVKSGMTVTVDIETSRHDNVLSVPNSAIKPYQGGKAVLVPGPSAKNKTAQFHYVPVKTGLKGVSNTEILSGVTEGTQVITSGLTTAQLTAAAK